MMTTLNMHPLEQGAKLNGEKGEIKQSVQIEGNYVRINGTYYNLSDLSHYSSNPYFIPGSLIQ